MKLEFENPLFIGAHPDDNCLSCGGTMSRLNREGIDFHCYTMTCFNEERERSLRSAMEFIQPKTYDVYPFMASYIEDHKREIRRTLLKIKNTVNPDVVFTHSVDSGHLDHRLLAQEIRKLFRYENMFSYHGLKEEGVFHPNTFIPLEEEDVITKIKLLGHFKLEAQYQDFLTPDAIRSRARVDGVKCGEKYAESFNLTRMKI